MNTPSRNPISRHRARLMALAALAVGLLLTPACYTGPQLPAQSAVGVQQNARRQYYEGMRALVAGNYEEAAQTFNQVARSPRYVRYAALAALRVGDTLYFQDRYAEAIQAYQHFINQFASNPNMPYARFQVAASYFHQMPSSWFAAPPAYENDQTMTHQAVRMLESFLKTFPTSRFSAQARKMLRDAEQMLVDRELYVADYYADRDKWKAAAWRRQYALDHYPAIATTPDNIWKMAQAYGKAGLAPGAKRAYGLYIQKFPKGRHVKAAKKAMSALEKAPTKADG